MSFQEGRYYLQCGPSEGGDANLFVTVSLNIRLAILLFVRTTPEVNYIPL
jgi:hypothetical protein